MARNKNTAIEVLDEDDATADTGMLSAKDLAAELGTDPKSFRRWLRSLTSTRAGKGGRWVFDADAADQVRKAWTTRSTKGTTPDIADAD
jgi:hypothetical protein